ncbi:MAG: kelch repeat-containing protein [Ignavibacteria bacterium]|nr:kelch repeat-containing protein [Ignavibacteria bacterium]
MRFFIIIVFLLTTIPMELTRSQGKPNGVIVTLGNMQSQRFAHTSTLLADGRVFIAGGQAAGSLASTEIYDPNSRTFLDARTMSVPRAGHSATLLRNGTVLLAGGYNGAYLSSAEIYHPKTNSFTSTGGMITARSGHEAILLNNGRVLLAGGVGLGWIFLASAELYDPETGTFTPTGSMTTARESHTATLLKDGRVLITGGHKDRRANMILYSSTELYNPSTGRFSLAGTVTVRRHKHDATLLSDGRVLVVGGADERDRDGAYTSAEIYDPHTGRSVPTTNMNLRRYKLRGTTILLQDRNVLVVGGSNFAELFDPETGVFAKMEGSMGTDRLFATATLLRNGQVLITGGYDERMITSSTAWLYQR